MKQYPDIAKEFEEVYVEINIILLRKRFLTQSLNKLTLEIASYYFVFLYPNLTFINLSVFKA